MPDYRRLASYFQKYGDVSIYEKPQFKLCWIDGIKTNKMIGHYRYPRVRIIIPSKDIVSLLKSEVGGNISIRHHNWYWEIIGDMAIEFCTNIRPHLTGKKKELCTYLIDYGQNAVRLGQTTRYKIWLDRIKEGKEAYHAFNPVEIL